MKIDLNADLGEGCASDSALLQLVSSANIACGFHAGDAVLMQQCVREALKKRRRYWRTPELPGPGKFRSNRDEVTARDGLRPGAVSNWLAGGNRTRPGGRAAARQTAWHVVQPGGERAAFGRRYRPCGARCRRRPGAGWAGGQRGLSAPDSIIS